MRTLTPLSTKALENFLLGMFRPHWVNTFQHNVAELPCSNLAGNHTSLHVGIACDSDVWVWISGMHTAPRRQETVSQPDSIAVLTSPHAVRAAHLLAFAIDLENAQDNLPNRRQRFYSERTTTTYLKKLFDLRLPRLEVPHDRWYCRTHDDTDGDRTQQLKVCIVSPGEAHVAIAHGTDTLTRSLRFRDQLGGGSSQVVRSALLLTHYAINLDNTSTPTAQ